MYFKNRFIPILRKLIFLSFTVVALYYTYLNLNKFELKVDNSIKLLTEYSTPYYVMLTDNTGYTNINGVSNFVINVQKDGYVLVQDLSNNEYIDMTFESEEDENMWRVYYNIKDSYVAIFSSKYESSGMGYTYINREY